MRLRTTVLGTGAVLVASLLGAVPSAAGAVGCVGNEVSGDVDGDGFQDQLIGDPGATVNGRVGAGLVEIRHGIASVDGNGQGLGSTTVVTQGMPGVGETAEAGDGFGSVALLTKVDDDSCADVVVSAPGEDVPGAADSGVVQVIFGSPAGLGGGRPAIVLRAGTHGLGGVPTAGDRFGASIAFGARTASQDRFTAPHGLAIGIPGRDLPGASDAGAVNVIAFSPAGVAFDPRLITQASPGVPGAPTTGSGFGSAVAMGFVGRVSQRWGDDLLVGTPGAHGGSGGVIVVGDHGAANPYEAWEWVEGSAGVKGSPQPGDRFGTSLTTFVDGINGSVSLAIGVPGQDVGTAVDAGAVHMMFMTWDATSAQVQSDTLITQNTAGVEDRAEAGDHFGAVLLLRFFWPGGFTPLLVVGVPDEDVGAVVDAGAVQLFSQYSLIGGTIGDSDRFVTASTLGVPGAPTRGAHLGASVGGRTTIGGDVLIGVPDDPATPGGAVLRVPTLTLYGFTTTVGSLWRSPSGVRYGTAISD